MTDSELKDAALVFGFLRTLPIKAVLPDRIVSLRWSSYACAFVIDGKSYVLDSYERVLAEDRKIVAKLPQREFGRGVYQSGSLEVAEKIVFDVAATHTRETSICMIDGDRSDVIAQFDHNFFRMALFTRSRKFRSKSPLAPLAGAVVVSTAIDWAIEW